MPIINRNDLVRAIEELRRHEHELVAASCVAGWCDQQNPPLDWGRDELGRRGRFFERAALEERRQRDWRLLKFKENQARNSRVYFGLRCYGDQARREACERGWFEVPWDPQRAGGRGCWG